ncbi:MULTISPECIES: helix-turn-helix domain-containing protein [Pseudoalteromonas]|nr:MULTISPECIES: helix-turn-helix transcriptional regulator [Pseudoalteromonas]MCG9768414.1 helix-turn-helix domain-containing protein [Pseudoalteromonas piscicida]WMO15888.1 helix-turn-helix domain-containing protein [Pseudoalteromonas piscicida]
MTEQEKGKTKMIEDLSLIGSKFSGENILYMRLSLGLSLRGFAKFLNMGVSHQTISNWENEYCKPSHGAYEECVNKYLAKKHKVKQNPARVLLLNPATVRYLKSLLSSVSKEERQQFLDKLDDGDR